MVGYIIQNQFLQMVSFYLNDHLGGVMLRPLRNSVQIDDCQFANLSKEPWLERSKPELR